MERKRINAVLIVAALALTLLIPSALPQASTAAPRLERQPLESLTALNSTEATERGTPLSAFSATSVASVVQSPGTIASVPVASNGLAESPWPMFGHDPQHTGRSEYVGPQDATLNWTYDLGELPWHSVSIGPDGIVYVADQNYLYAITGDGELLWRYQPDGGGVDSSPAIGPDGTVYVSSWTEGLFALGPDGAVRWKWAAMPSLTPYGELTISPDGTI